MTTSERSPSGQDFGVAKVVLDLTTAEEVVELIEDVPGQADEALLDEALEALAVAGARVPPTDQERAARGEAVAIELRPADVDAVQALITRDRVTHPRSLRRVGQRLRGKLQRARRKARRS